MKYYFECKKCKRKNIPVNEETFRKFVPDWNQFIRAAEERGAKEAFMQFEERCPFCFTGEAVGSSNAKILFGPHTVSA
jgi:hypothetical protein